MIWEGLAMAWTGESGEILEVASKCPRGKLRVECFMEWTLKPGVDNQKKYRGRMKKGKREDHDAGNFSLLRRCTIAQVLMLGHNT